MSKYTKIHGERFRIEYSDDGSIFIEHPQWPLNGIGETLAKAIRNVLQTSQVLYPEYRDADNLDAKATDMRDWMEDVHGLHVDHSAQRTK